MATTTNYGWTTPDDTALVKDGASAIRSLGSSADTTVKNLNPGTTAGDIDYYTSGTAKARIAIGTAGQVLTVNSGATAPQWSSPSAGGMTLISTTTLTGSSVTISSIPTTYKDLVLHIRAWYTANGTLAATFNMRQNGVTTASSYRYVFDGSEDNVGTLKALAGGVASAYNTQGISTTTDTQNFSYFRFYDYANTSHYKVVEGRIYGYRSAVSGAFYRFLGVQTTDTAAITSLDLFPAAGNWGGGSALLYGVS